jgi:alcohol dehydrogenase class IV
MSMASMLGGMALANVKLGAFHGFAGPVGGMFPVAHGAVCTCLS